MRGKIKGTIEISGHKVKTTSFDGANVYIKLDTDELYMVGLDPKSNKDPGVSIEGVKFSNNINDIAGKQIVNIRSQDDTYDGIGGKITECLYALETERESYFARWIIKHGVEHTPSVELFAINEHGVIEQMGRKEEVKLEREVK